MTLTRAGTGAREPGLALGREKGLCLYLCGTHGPGLHWPRLDSTTYDFMPLPTALDLFVPDILRTLPISYCCVNWVFSLVSFYVDCFLFPPWHSYLWLLFSACELGTEICKPLHLRVVSRALLPHNNRLYQASALPVSHCSSSTNNKHPRARHYPLLQEKSTAEAEDELHPTTSTSSPPFFCRGRHCCDVLQLPFNAPSIFSRDHTLHPTSSDTIPRRPFWANDIDPFELSNSALVHDSPMVSS